MKQHVIFEADDFGLTHTFNAGIKQAFSQGSLTSTNLRTNGTAYDAAIEFASGNPTLGIGVHLNIVEGPCLRKTTRTDPLCDAAGSYCYGFLGLWRRRHDKTLLASAADDFRHQIETVLSSGIRPDHLNAHQHCNTIPELFEISCQLAEEYSIPYVRISNEDSSWFSAIKTAVPSAPLNVLKWALLKKLAPSNEAAAARYNRKTNERFVGIIHSGIGSYESVTHGLQHSSAKVIEVLLHPCAEDPLHPDVYVAPYLRQYCTAPDRARELAILTSADLRQFLVERDLTPCSYRDLTDPQLANPDEPPRPTDSPLVD